MTDLNNDFEKLCYACRVGDIDIIESLISTGVNLNDVDKFDNSPLFLASLCGHEEVVSLLLERGAVCDRDRYEGARCIYGALTDRIRDILLAYDVSKAVDVIQPFSTHVSSLFKEPIIHTSDLSITFDNLKMKGNIHKFILQIYCDSLINDLKVTSLSNEVTSADMIFDQYKNDNLKKSEQILLLLIKYIYLIPILYEIRSEDYRSILNYSTKYKLDDLTEFIDKISHISDPTEKSGLMIEFQSKITESARSKFNKFVKTHILKEYMEHSVDELIEYDKITGILCNSPGFPDLIISVKDFNSKIRFYPCHLAMLSRCGYFERMFTLPMSEYKVYSQIMKHNINELQSIPIVSFPQCDFDVFETIIKYFYCDDSKIPWDCSLATLKIADFLMDDRLKSMAAVSITQSNEILQTCSIYDILYTAWETRVERLEHFVAKIFAYDISTYQYMPEFSEAIMRSSNRISERQDSDTIELIDDIKYYLLEKYSFEQDDVEFFENETDMAQLNDSGILEYKRDIKSIESILKKLGLSSQR